MGAQGNTMKPMKYSLLIATLLTLVACTGVPQGITPINPFSLERYSGTWYEIARFDHSFERGLSQVTATYTQNSDGSVAVLNRGFKSTSQAWSEAEGIAKFSGASNVGHLEVSFFRPFYASYVVVDLDDDYNVSMVTGYDRSYLWFLARTPTISDAEKARLVARATELGFDVQQLIWVDQ